MPFVETFQFSLFFIVVIGLSMGYALRTKVYAIFLESIWQMDFLFPLKFSKAFKNINCFKNPPVIFEKVVFCIFDGELECTYTEEISLCIYFFIFQ